MDGIHVKNVASHFLLDSARRFSSSPRSGCFLYRRAWKQPSRSPAPRLHRCGCGGSLPPLFLERNAGRHHRRNRSRCPRASDHPLHRNSDCGLGGGRRHSHHGVLWAANHFPILFPGDGASAVLDRLRGDWQLAFHHRNGRRCAVWDWLCSWDSSRCHSRCDCFGGLLRG